MQISIQSASSEHQTPYRTSLLLQVHQVFVTIPTLPADCYRAAYLAGVRPLLPALSLLLYPPTPPLTLRILA
eukprot:760234-Hanusia_phi.AAC.1